MAVLFAALVAVSTGGAAAAQGYGTFSPNSPPKMPKQPSLADAYKPKPLPSPTAPAPTPSTRSYASPATPKAPEPFKPYKPFKPGSVYGGKPTF
ncbi:hypothetical protein [Phenylobacterium sp. VNQ135]|uniref:hypothetical protein n=1 Tax=Phenylobacterium sp. VNQ135 TaxID=3400922 RepID=UPI003C2B7C93